METTPALDFWWRFAAMLALEASVIVLIAFALQSVIASAVWRRTIWQACALGVLTLLAVELSGGSRVFAGWMKGPQVTFTNMAPEDRGFSVTISEWPKAESRSPSIPAPDRTSRSWWPGILWLAGSVMLIGRMLFVRFVFLLHGSRRRSADDRQLLARVHELSVRLGIRRRVRVFEVGGLRGPIAFGILRPAIGLPKDFSTFTSREQDAMLIHELAHLAARDPVWYSLVDLLAALMWWHPLIWWIRRRLHIATETAADDACVLVEDGPNILAEALVRLGSRLLERQRLGLLGIHGNGFRSDLGRRVERLMRLGGGEWRPMSRARAWMAKAAGPVVLVGITLCCCAWIMPAQSSPEKEWKDSLAGRTLATVLQSITSRDQTTYVGRQSVGPFPAFQTFRDTRVLDWKGTDVGPFPTLTTSSLIRLAETADGQVPSDASSKRNERPLSTRTFKVDPVTFMKRLQEATAEGVRDLKPASTAQADAMRQFFAGVGVELTSPKALFWNDRIGMLMVRAPLEELDAIEQAIQVLNVQPPQVTIEVKIAEMPEAAVKQLGLDWLGTTVTATISANQARNPFVDTNATAANYAMVLTDTQYRMVLRALEQRTGVDALTLPKVTTLGGRQTQIKTVNIKSVVTGTAEKADQSGVFDLVITRHECGPIIDAVAMVRADGYTIDLTVITTSREFLGYESTRETVKVLGDDGKIGSAPKPLPEFRVRQAVATPTLWDGQTLAMGMGKFEGKERVAFVTVTIIDPAGNRVHSEDEGEFRTRGIPPQRKVSEPNGTR